MTINYRLGIFGFFAHPELSAESKTGTSGNYGLSDQLEALRWVQRNIATYGGDPHNVTIFGESAGSWAVSLLVATPKSEGLFHKAIGESGAYLYSMPHLKEAAGGIVSAEQAGQAFARAAGNGSIASLRSMPAVDLQAKAEALHAVNAGQLAIVDGYYFDNAVRDIFAQGAQRKVPVLAGFNSDEGSGLSDYFVVAPVPSSSASYEAEVRTRFGDLAKQWRHQYPANDPTAAVFDAYRDSEFGWRMEEWVKATARAGQPAYFYYFAHKPPMGDTVREFARLLMVVLALSTFYGLYNGSMVVFLTEFMPPSIRTAAFSLAYSIATALFGGFTPLVSTALIKQTGDKAIPAAWLGFAAIVSIAGALLARRSHIRANAMGTELVA